MRILTVGGGSGGHVTPVVAVVAELKKSQPKADIRFWCDRKFAPQARAIVHNVDPDLRVDTVFAGKLRRYHSLSIWQQLARPFSIVLPNIRDIFYIIVGFFQSIIKLIVWRPDVVFTKGGFVCLPVGIAAYILKIPLVIHDSDAHAGLTNRVLARFAKVIATGAPLANYTYQKEKTYYVGVPISRHFYEYTESERRVLKTKLGFKPDKPLVVATGGGLGAESINEAVAKCLKKLLPKTSVALVSGTVLYDSFKAITPQDEPDYQLHAFIDTNLYEYLAAADIVVSRAGATTLLELEALAKPTVLIPSPYLSGGHQLKNAELLHGKNAVFALDELELDKDADVLFNAITSLLDDPARMKSMGKAFHEFAKPHAAPDTAKLIITAAK